MIKLNKEQEYKMDNERAEMAIEMLVNTKTRDSIIEAINEYGATINWDGYSDRQILEEVWRSDKEAGEESDGILAGIYEQLI